MITARTSVFALAALAALTAGIWLARAMRAPAPGPALRSGVLLPEPRPLPPFSLRDQDDRPFTNARLLGHWSLLFAGYTHCPDVCPTTLGTLKVLTQKLQDRAPATIFLSVDPERDTPAALKPYVGYFGANVTGVSGSHDELERICAGLGVAYLKVPGKAPDDYAMDHSAALVLLDPQGRVAGYFPPPHKVDTLAADLTRVLAVSR